MKVLRIVTLVLSVLLGVCLRCSAETVVKTEVSKSFNPKEIKRIAIIPFRNDVLGYSHAVSDTLATEFLAMGFDVVERTELKSILGEIKLAGSGAVDAATARELGKLINVDGIVFGAMSSNLGGGVYTLNLRLIDTRSGSVLLTSNYFSSSGKRIANVMHDLIDSISRKAFNRKLQRRGKVVLANNLNVARKKLTKIAMLPFMGPSEFGESDSLFGNMATELVGGTVDLVERKGVSEILEEQARSASGLYNQITENAIPSGKEVPISTRTISEISLSRKDLADIGVLTGADGLLVGSFSPVYTELPFLLNVLNMRLVDIQTGRVLWGASYYSGGAGYETSLPEVFELMAIAIVPAIKTDTPETYLKEFRQQCQRSERFESSVRPQITDYQN